MSEFRTNRCSDLAPGVVGFYADAPMIPNPHDALFKAVYGQPEHARGMLRAIVPAPLAGALDWSTLTLQPGSFVEAALRHRHTDLLYSATWRTGDEALAYLPIYCSSISPRLRPRG